MNIGGEPGQDDYGLPRIDIEIPDDARELDRDVQAYYRELRAQRRRRLARKLFSPLARDGMILPLLAGCLALTLLAGTLLTVFTTGQRAQAPAPPAGTSRSRSGPAPASRGRQFLPDAIVTVNGQQESLRALVGTALVLAVVPHTCQCLAGVRRIVSQAQAAGIQAYVIGGPGPQVLALTRRAGLGVSHAVEDTQRSLPAAFWPGALTAMLVSSSGRVAQVVSGDRHGFSLTGALRSLRAGGQAGAGAGSTPGAVATQPAAPAISTPAG